VCRKSDADNWRFLVGFDIPGGSNNLLLSLCSLQAMKHAESPKTMCWTENEDYFECLHGFKEKKRILAVRAERERREKLGEKFDIPDS
jgi:hypothetical protein